MGELKVIPLPSGSVLLKGPFEIYSAEGSLLLRGTRAALCSCGKAKDQPFCDGSHMPG